ncbi:hypothetical protein AAG906_009732 [Vitis piasezkii]
MAPSIDGYLRFHVDNKLVYDTLEGIVQKAAFDSCESCALWKRERRGLGWVSFVSGLVMSYIDCIFCILFCICFRALEFIETCWTLYLPLDVLLFTISLSIMSIFPSFVSSIILYLPPSTTHSSLPPPPHIWILQRPQPNFIEGLDALFTHHLPRALHHPICLPDSHI